MADEKTVENGSHLEARMSRRSFMEKMAAALGGGIVAGGAGGFVTGREFQHRVENPNEITDEPWEIQIRKLELRGQKEGLKDENLRGLHTWLICMWYGANHSYGVFADPNDEYAAASAMYQAISFIDKKDDPKLKGHEDSAGWTVARDSITMNLTSSDFSEDYITNSTGGTITPLMQVRDTLVHELTHFITEDRKEAGAIDIVKQMRPDLANINDVTVRGFRMIFDPDPNNPDVPVVLYLDDFDEASPELIANYHQRTAGLAVGLPTYPEENQTETNQSKIERTLDALEATLKLSGISMDQFAQFHASSDLDGLAIAFADSTDRLFQEDSEKIQYGLSVIVSLKELNRKVIGEHIQNIKS